MDAATYRSLGIDLPHHEKVKPRPCTPSPAPAAAVGGHPAAERPVVRAARRIRRPAWSTSTRASPTPGAAPPRTLATITTTSHPSHCTPRPQAGPPTPLSAAPPDRPRVCRSRQRLPGAPEGTIHRFPGWSAPANSVFPDTTRDWAVYVPAQHDGTTPASLLVALDGAGFLNEEEGGLYRTPTVADNLIHSGTIPPTVIVFVNPGQHAEYTEQRSREYDTVRAARSYAHRSSLRCCALSFVQRRDSCGQVSEDNVRFITEEILPIVEDVTTLHASIALLSRPPLQLAHELHVVCSCRACC